jgi:small subunit ribosomal protein S20
MPRRATSKRTHRADERKHLRNLRIKKTIKKTLKEFQEFLASKNAAEAKKVLSRVFAQLDKAAKKGILHPNTAGRKKSRLSLALRKTA